jgi:hypothetical protein
MSTRTRPRYLPIIEAKEGMVLGSPLKVVNNGVLRLFLPAGTVLTSDTLHQLIVHRAEYCFIDEPDTRSDQEVALNAALMAHRVMHIFSGADLSDPNMAALFDRVLTYRSA